MTTYFCNVFTTAMLSVEPHTFSFNPISVEQVKVLLSDGFEQAVGHPATCEVLSQRLGIEIKPVRANVRLRAGDTLVVAQVVVPRLEEGQVLTKAQVDALSMTFWLVKEQ